MRQERFPIEAQPPEKDRYFYGMECEHWQEFYPNHCVILHENRVLGHAKRFEDMRSILVHAEKSGIHMKDMAILFIDDPQATYNELKRKIEKETSPEQDVFHPQEETLFLKECFAAMRRDIRLDLEWDAKNNHHDLHQRQANAEETHQQTTQALNDRYTSKQWDAIIYQAIKARDARILHNLNDPLLNTNKDHLFIAAKAVQDMQRVFSRVTFSPFSDEESA